MSRGSKPGFALLLPLTLSLFAAGCGGGGGGSEDVGGIGSLTVTLTDSPAHDVARFTVDVTAVTLTSTEANVVTGLNHAITVDLAALTRSSQVFSIQAVDGGHYTLANVTLDFTNSSCFLVGQTTEATLLDDDGAPLLGTVTLPIDLTATPTIVQNGGRYEFELDFDLDQSLTVDNVANTVVVAPSLLVRTNRTDAHVNVASGALTSVSTADGSAVLDLETPTKFSLGPAQLNFSTSTVFQVDGVPTVGAAGVALLAGKTAGTWVQAYVAVNPAGGTASIAYVEAGRGTFNGGQGLVEGVIVDRGDTSGGNKLFTIHGRSSSSDHATEQFNQDFLVTMKPGGAGVGTRVVSEFSSLTTFSLDSLNVGQRVLVFGTLAGTSLDATATTGIARALPTSLFAVANSAPAAGILKVDLVVPAPFARVEEVEVDTVSSPFAWGADNGAARDPNDFRVSGTFSAGLGIGAGDHVRMDVNFSSINNATFDAAADTVAKLSDTTRLLSLRDRAAGMALGTQVVGTQIQFTVDLTVPPVAGERAALDKGLLGSDDLADGAIVLVGPGASAISYCLQDATAGSVTMFKTFGAFVTGFGTALTGGRIVKDFVAAGSFDVGSGTLSATTVTAIVQ